MAWAAQDSPWYTEDEKGQILAWSYGLLTHSAGDHFAHTLVNEFAEGVAPGFFAAGASIGTDQRDLGNMLRHIMTEAYIADAMEGVDTNPEISQVVAAPGDTYTVAGDYSSVSTPGIEFNAPTRFIYEALLRPFAQDPTAIVEMKWTSGTLSVENGNQFVRTEGKWTPSADLFGDGDGFKVGHKITVSGFADPANNGTFIVTAVTDTVLTVDATLVDEPASGDEKIRVFVPFTPTTTITVNDADNTFTRATGNFKDEGFVEGMRFTVYGLHNYEDNYLVKSVSDDGKTLTVWQNLNSGYEVGNGDEQVVVLGSRGAVVDGLYKLRDFLEMKAIASGPRQDFVQLLVQYGASKLPGNLTTAPTTEQLAGAYLYNWIEDIDAGIENWAEVGLAFTKAMWDPQSKRDLQNSVADELEPALDDSALSLPETDGDYILRRDAEATVGVLDVFLKELDDPNNDESTEEGYLNNYVLPMLGLPDFTGEVRVAL